ncbi:MAG: chemotaxis response regulator protein-glutamate methylesterase [Oligoflexia bacterium]|nr:chemotaxis response regulator protein-glutamate methylesterase [Oligoflexia bacterium]MBF0364335.1 chemotaxis response regulator protein-glutamate methylesterase [Oligoflexia bacterium]
MKKRVLIIDDSALIREILTEVINKIPGFEVVGSAPDPHYGAEKVVKLNPDIITLDIEMPKMDGLTFLEKLMRLRPLPVLIISSLAAHNSETALKALELGAVDYIPKPTKKITEVLPEITNEIRRKLEMCAVCRISASVTSKGEVDKKYAKTAKQGEVLKKSNKVIAFQTTDKIIAIGASTGGTVAIAKLLEKCPPNLPGMVIVQHMPKGFTQSFATRLNKDTELVVKEAEDNDAIIPGQVLIAPGDQHMVVDRSGARYFVRLHSGPPIKHHRPSVELLFSSVANTAGPNAIGIILTGMGDDGADGMLEMRQNGANTIAQDESSSTVFGMPKVAIEKGGVETVLKLPDIAPYLQKYKIT